MSLAAAVAVCDVAGGGALVKWPNDVVLRRGDGLAKLGGILLEGRPQAGWVVIGIGLNVAVDHARLPHDLQTTAATLGRGGEAIEPLLAELLPALQRRLTSPPEQMLAAWRGRDALLGARVRWSSGPGIAEGVDAAGVAEGVDAAGRLLVATESGRRVALDSGEVHLL